MEKAISEKIIKILFLLLFSYFFLLCISSYPSDFETYETDQFNVHFEHGLNLSANEAVQIFPEIKLKLESTFKSKIDFFFNIILINNRDLFLKLANNRNIVAFASPDKNLIVIDYSKMNTSPFNFETSFSHELCHLLLHHNMNVHLPRWLDEGIAQWFSDGIDELIRDSNKSLLDTAAITGNFLPLGQITYSFPETKKKMTLAYEQSKSFLIYLINEYGKDKIIDLILLMKNGKTCGFAFNQLFNHSIRELEYEWKKSLQQTGLFTFLSRNLYEILFVFMAIISVFAYFKIRIRKKRYYEEEDEEDENENESVIYSDRIYIQF